jgi:hypothetical protein
MSGKSAKVAAMVAGLDPGPWDRRYVGWFVCFNRGEFYEAHDVLEDLWLAEGKGGVNYGFYKGLIQLAGAFVHLQKGRLGPAVALFRLAEANFARYPGVYAGMDLAEVTGMSVEWRRRVETGEGANPLIPGGEVPVVRRPEETPGA